MAMPWHCPLCGRRITGQQNKAVRILSKNNYMYWNKCDYVCAQSHYRNLWKRTGDRTRCDALPIIETAPELDGVPILEIIETPITPIILEPSECGVYDLARRKPMELHTERSIRSAYTITGIAAHHPLSTRAKNIVAIQLAWDKYKNLVKSLCSPTFWAFFLPLHSFSTAAIDTALGSAKKVFLTRNTIEWKSFPPTKRTLLRKIKSLQVDFWSNVQHTVKIDVSAFKLPGISWIGKQKHLSHSDQTCHQVIKGLSNLRFWTRYGAGWRRHVVRIHSICIGNQLHSLKFQCMEAEYSTARRFCRQHARAAQVCVHDVKHEYTRA